MKTYVHLWYLAEFFLERELFQTNDAEEIKTHFIFNNFFSVNRAFHEDCEKIW
jgi:hypothetical protein